MSTHTKTYLITTQADLQTVAKAFATLLQGGDRVGLIGSLGSGKTTFTQHLARSLGVTAVLDSPTFVLRQSFPVPRHPTIQSLVHSDLYRLTPATKPSRELLETGILDDWQNPDTLVILEWIDRFPTLEKDLTYILHFTWNKTTHVRQVTITSHKGTV